MTEDNEQESREIEQKEIYLEFPDSETEPYKSQPQQIIEIEQVRRLAMLHCSYNDMAKFFGVKENTFINNFRFEVERCRETTKHRLMEAMLENAIQKHNPAIQIFLAKNWLGLVNDPVAQEGVTPLPWIDE